MATARQRVASRWAQLLGETSIDETFMVMADRLEEVATDYAAAFGRDAEDARRDVAAGLRVPFSLRGREPDRKLGERLRDALIALRDVMEELADLKRELLCRSLSDPAEERGPTRVEPLRPENPDEEAPIRADCNTTGGRSPDDDDGLVFVIDSRRPLEAGDLLRVFSNYRGELARYRFAGDDGLGGGILIREPVTDE